MVDNVEARKPIQGGLLEKRPSRRMSRRTLLKFAAGASVTAAASAPLIGRALGINKGESGNSAGSFSEVPDSGQISGTPIPEIPTQTPESNILTPEPPTPTEVTHDPNSLAALATRAGKTVGTEFSGVAFNDPKWREVVQKEFNLGVLEYGAQWRVLEPQRGQMNFSVLDRMVKLAKDNKMKMRVHALIYAEQTYFLPTWLINGNFSPQEMEQIIRDHIGQVMDRYPDVNEWVVVNEPYKAPLRVRKEDGFFDALGKDYVSIAFDEARKHNRSNATLILNDTQNHSSTGLSLVKLDKDIIRMLGDAGLVDDKFALGIQGHINGAVTIPTDVTSTLKDYGVEVKITECDVDMSKVAGTPEERNTIQSQRYMQFLQAVEDSGVCDSYNFWGLGDKHSWLERSGRPNADPTLFDDDLNPKPARETIGTFFASLPPVTE